RAGSEGNWSYTATDPKKPVNYVSVYDAMRFTNWLTNGATTGADTETGMYTLSEGSAIPSNPTVGRNIDVNGTTLTGTGDLSGVTGTVWALPSEDEWYKAAYYNVDTSEYSLYPNGSDTITGAEANYYDPAHGYTAISLTDAISYAEEQNGTFDMGGNVFEWNDSLRTTWDGQDIGDSNARSVRGGSFPSNTGTLASSGCRNYSGDIEYSYLGFRVAALSGLTAVPEPGTYAAAMGLLILVIGVWVRRGRRPL
ncbi:MAG: formylglycine-generating enzyme family protein, partial [Opitutaceae bacterium]|nr:formylglycine-generating enzyme family protein [Opitutaceae bacterium]